MTAHGPGRAGAVAARAALARAGVTAITIIAVVALAFAAVAPARAIAAAAETPPTPVGRWKTVDDQTGEFKAIVVISEAQKGMLEGRIERVFSPPSPSLTPLCDQCSGDLKNKPVIGMRVLWDFAPDGQRYSGGHLFDPEHGKTYKGTLKVIDGGRKLEVRGYIGFSMLGRTQVWTRE